MSKTKQSYQPGDLVSVPLEGGFGAALVYRWDERKRRGARSILVLGFDQISDCPFAIEQVEDSKPHHFSSLSFQGDACIHHGDWPVLGPLRSFSYERWPTPIVRLGREYARWRDDYSTYDIPAECIAMDELDLVVPFTGFGTARGIESDIEIAVRSRNISRYFPLSDRHIEVWKAIAERARKMGIE